MSEFTQVDRLAEAERAVARLTAEVEALRRERDDFRDEFSVVLRHLGEGGGSDTMTPERWRDAVLKGVDTHITVLESWRKKADEGRASANAAYIAAADPTTIRALAADWLALREGLREVREMLRERSPFTAEEHRHVAAIKARLDALLTGGSDGK